jgi:hypothetical protein
MTKWKVYTVMWIWDKKIKKPIKRYIPWDGTVVEAESRQEATFICDEKITYSRYYEYYDAVPDYWEVPLEINYIQPELF